MLEQTLQILKDTMDWALFNPAFSLWILIVVICFLLKKRLAIYGLATIYGIAWVVFNVLGIAELDAFTFEEANHGGLPNIDITFIGWILFFLCFCFLFSEADSKSVPVKKPAKKITKKTVAKKSKSNKKTPIKKEIETNEKEVDDLFDNL